MAFLYPWGNTQQLNLDWILQKIKELEAGSGGADLDEVANALISASYAVQAYDRSDIVFRDGKLYRANQAIPAPGETWTPAHWDEILLGDTVSNLVQYVAALSNDQIVNSSTVTGTHTSDALDTLKNAIDNITVDSDSVSNESQVTGATVSDALNTLNSTISTEVTARGNADTALQGQISANVETTTTASKAYSQGEYLVLNGVLYKVTQAIANGGTITIGTNVNSVTISDMITNALLYKVEELAIDIPIGFSIITLGSQVTDPPGWRYMTTIATFGSSIEIRNNLIIIGLTPNHAALSLYTPIALSGNLTIRHYFIKEALTNRIL